MMSTKNIVVEEIQYTPVEKQRVELVERKGKGHPDCIADGIAESVSRELCREYIKRYGTILHHNTDQAEVVGGMANPTFGGGEVIKPIYILISGRATTFVGDEVVGVSRIAVRAAKKYIKQNFRFLDPEEHVIIDCRIGHGSADLIDVFRRGRDYPLANDTSFGVGFAPLTETERLVLETERYLNSERFKKELPETGEDIKVMGLRIEDKVKLTIACAMISSLIPDLSHYISVKEEVKRRVEDLAARITEREVEVYVNTADDYEKACVYLTVTGTSAEMGDDGSVGRGNRVNGLITPNRPMSLEAAAGKNPVNHVGKLYNLLANMIANRIAEEIDGCSEVYVRLLSQIGKPINEPLVASVQIVPEEGCSIAGRRSDIEAIVEDYLDNKLRELKSLILEDKLSVF